MKAAKQAKERKNDRQNKKVVKITFSKKTEENTKIKPKNLEHTLEQQDYVLGQRVENKERQHDENERAKKKYG